MESETLGQRLLPVCALGTRIVDDKELMRRNQKKLMLVCGFCLFFMSCEIMGGLYAGSLALLGDAAHLFSDIAGFLISLVALRLTSRTPTETHSFGFHRAEVIGALLSVSLIWAMTIFLVVEAVQRVLHPEPVEGLSMLFVASVGLGVNIV
jgi:solute carrier family 30 (zinc transporter), member 2